MWIAFSLNEYDKLKLNSLSNIVAMKIDVIFEFNSSSADTNLEWMHQPGHFQILSKF